ncbi:hypothetical protein JD844_022469 [Phrynosoma platyrhinos]|uniref:Uncharacterized protein n=1 Tax=Phrynosoma platyrhinos TaxID=52577 RepID=A0ABQ7SVQ1_PHRPL|nr:hypothetical protein JD844_022469 [Phrynosoma platyrhinos]
MVSEDDTASLQNGFLHSLTLFSSQEFGSKKSITSRCDFIENLIANGCAGHMESTKSSINTVKNLPLSSKGSSGVNSDVTQIMPQKILLNLRPGELTTNV